ncbi:HAD family phosphatase [Puniceicoccales bacterium CK1056]|uniref:HAD family phosphatase n=1 Tax=Oceanipulchritudo coccoides TaxID=2706888 RepID=A0A6B2LZE3_9BACT|nr:HAD family phosphatase [Oceanipulchritudo coccoides]NDV61314.1 HAD family phosphatase [Oceanipulchritudo coccoides]
MSQEEIDLCVCALVNQPIACPFMDAILQIRGFLLDMDGLLLDTEKVSHRSWLEAEQETGFQMPAGFHGSLIGQSMVAIGTRLRQVMDPRCDVEAFLKVAERIYRSLLKDAPIPLKPGTVDFLEYLCQMNVPRCLATSTHRELCEQKLASTGLASLIPLRVCGDDVKHSKPAPDIYLEAASRIGEVPSSLLVLEDSENGIRAALSAGCQVAHIPDIGPVSLDWQVRTDCVFRSLDDVKAALERGEIQVLS